MNGEDHFERQLQRVPQRPVPAAWRAEILSAARKERLACDSSGAAHASVLGTLNSLLSKVLWPNPKAWAGLAAVWLVILGINLTTRDGSQAVAKQASPLSPQMFMAFQEQERMLSELIGPREAPVVERPKPTQPRPRSELRHGLLMA